MFQVNNNADLEKFCDKLVDDNFFPAAAYINRSDNRQMQIEQYQADNDDYIEFKCGTVDYMFAPIRHAQTGCIVINRGWTDFVSYAPTTELVRKICSETMGYFDSTEAIYLSDMYSYDYFFDKMGWPDIKKSLERRFGPPAGKIEDIYKEFDDYIETTGYFIEFK
ncbi:hypothetical protein [Paenibacillus sp. MMS18-CY102]|uniref:hypothetical protein n=1 Tax=Paenibacillus sp. MMS18-CY102 TaxID=2682849 RepID=UPI0013651E04|nr:hypothetical protein [Paenibacillus sp. MMS18-CY102]MWC30325.1 hypothetical protein [Paenibacillus sp. MMS18-CY102]